MGSVQSRFDALECESACKVEQKACSLIDRRSDFSNKFTTRFLEAVALKEQLSMKS